MLARIGREGLEDISKLKDVSTVVSTHCFSQKMLCVFVCRVKTNVYVLYVHFDIFVKCNNWKNVTLGEGCVLSSICFSFGLV